MLDDQNVIRQRDPSDALGISLSQFEQTEHHVNIQQPEHDGRAITQVIVAGMGGSGLAAMLIQSWLRDTLTVPFHIVRTYSLPAYVNESTLVIASSYSGNTEETLNCLSEARVKHAQVAIMTSGGALKQLATEGSIVHVELPGHVQPRMTTIYQLRALTALLHHFGVTSSKPFDELATTASSLHQETAQWGPDVTTDSNYAKQLALLAVGKTPVFYAGSLMAPVAYKWKISWNESAKNVAFWDELPEFNHNEFMGWTSHPVEKPFAIFDLVSSFEHPQIIKRFEISDRLLSGKRPKSTVIALRGDTPLQHMLWASILADFVSIYVAVLNGVDPTPVSLIEKLKAELVA